MLAKSEDFESFQSAWLLRSFAVIPACHHSRLLDNPPLADSNMLSPQGSASTSLILLNRFQIVKLPGGILMLVSRVTRIAAVAFTLASLTVMSRAQSATWKLPDYSALQSMGNLPPGKVYQSGSNVRAEPAAGLVTIYQSSNNKVYNLYARGYCIEMPAEKALTPNPLQLLFGAKVERTPIGNAVVDGHSCRIEKVVVTGADGKTTESKVWEAEDMQGVPVKIQSQTEHGLLMAVYNDIVLAKPDPALFTLPDKCIPIEKMGEVAKGQGFGPPPPKPGEAQPAKDKDKEQESEPKN